MSTETTANKVLKRGGNNARDRRSLVLGFKFRTTPVSEGEDISEESKGRDWVGMGGGGGVQGRERGSRRVDTHV